MPSLRNKEKSAAALAVSVEDRALRLADMLRRVLTEGADHEERAHEAVRIFLFRVLLLLLAEARGMLPAGWPGESFFRALRSRALDPGGRASGYGLWTALNRIFRHTARRSAGSKRARAGPFLPGGGMLFDSDSFKLLEGFHCPDALLEEALAPLAAAMAGGNPAPALPGRLYEKLLTSRISRRRSGSYYTDPALVDPLIRTALVPVVSRALKDAGLGVRGSGEKPGPLLAHAALDSRERGAAERILLEIKVVDPSCGGGAFLVAAQDFLALELARVRGATALPEPSLRDRALEDVLLHCIHGVDRDPMAVELAKASLWLNARARDLAPGALDRNLKCGDALVGAPLLCKDAGSGAHGWPLAVPDGAFQPLDGEESRTTAVLRERNRREAEAPLPGRDPPGHPSRTACDLWTAAFFHAAEGGERNGVPVTTRHFRTALDADERGLPADLLKRVRQLGDRFGFFHWRIEFPEVFGRRGEGFDCVLGNPPWERIKVQEREFFASLDPEIARAGSASSRARLISRLRGTNPRLLERYRAGLRRSAMLSRFFRHCGRYALAGRGDPNFYLYFAVLSRDLLSRRGRAGLVIPTGIATDLGASRFFSDLTEQRSLVSLFDFVNRKRLFRGIAGPNRFSLLTLAGSRRPSGRAVFQFYNEGLADLEDGRRRFTLTARDLELINPNTRTCPPFTGRTEAELMKRIYRRVPVLVDESGGDGEGNPWGLRFWNMFHMSNDSTLFRTREQLLDVGFRPGPDGGLRKGRAVYLRLYEAKLFHNLNHRYNTFAGVNPAHRAGIKPRTLSVDEARARDPSFVVEPRYWVPLERVEETVHRIGWPERWFLALRGVTNVTTNRRSAVAAILPWCGLGNSVVILQTARSAREAALLAACLSSFAFDYTARQKLCGPNMNFFILKQLPVPPPSAFRKAAGDVTLEEYLLPRVLEMTYTAHEMAPFARACGYEGPPFPWDEERRARLRAEMDAVFFLMYGMTDPEAEAALDTFPILERQEKARFGEFRQRRLTLECLTRFSKVKIVSGTN